MIYGSRSRPVTVLNTADAMRESVYSFAVGQRFPDKYLTLGAASELGLEGTKCSCGIAAVA